MIRNFIFDMGNVVLTYRPREMALRFTRNARDAEDVRKALFESPEWPMGDQGLLTEEEIVERVCARAPERLHEDIRRAMAGWDQCMRPMPGAEEFIRARKAEGKGIYLLSNAAARFDRYAPRYPIFGLFDGFVVSAKVLMIKPDEEIFRYLLTKYSLKAGECFFLDDVAENVEGAKRVGIDGLCFDGDYGRLQTRLTQKGII